MSDRQEHHVLELAAERQLQNRLEHLAAALEELREARRYSAVDEHAAAAVDDAITETIVAMGRESYQRGGRGE